MSLDHNHTFDGYGRCVCGSYLQGNVLWDGAVARIVSTVVQLTGGAETRTVLVRGHEDAMRMVYAIHSAVHTLDQTGTQYLESVLRELAEAAYAYAGDWLTKADYGHKRPGWMSEKMWDSLRDPSLINASESEGK